MVKIYENKTSDKFILDVMYDTEDYYQTVRNLNAVVSQDGKSIKVGNTNKIVTCSMDAVAVYKYRLYDNMGDLVYEIICEKPNDPNYVKSIKDDLVVEIVNICREDLLN